MGVEGGGGAVEEAAGSWRVREGIRREMEGEPAVGEEEPRVLVRNRHR